ncbi:MAG: hypothetical protein JAZ11_07000 [Candidatus Thiodiazotropha lotti]|nr:hypothetical protein [Candidatus Thiodiazotropha lotti]
MSNENHANKPFADDWEMYQQIQTIRVTETEIARNGQIVRRIVNRVPLGSKERLETLSRYKNSQDWLHSRHHENGLCVETPYNKDKATSWITKFVKRTKLD